MASAADLPMGQIAPLPSAAATSAQSSVSSAGDQLHTLDEPVLRTIMRDVRMVGAKLALVLSPRTPSEVAQRELKSWDLWGPLVLCLALSAVLSLGAPDDQKSLVFSSVFALVWTGAAVVTANAQLLGGKVGFFWSVSALGYCLSPLLLASLGGLLSRSPVVRGPLVAGGVVWCCRACLLFFGDLVPASRRALAAFPVALFYTLLGWMVLVA